MAKFPCVAYVENLGSYCPYTGEVWEPETGWHVFLSNDWSPGPVFSRQVDAEIGLKCLLDAGVDMNNIDESLQTLFPNDGDVTKCMCEHLQW